MIRLRLVIMSLLLISSNNFAIVGEEIPILIELVSKTTSQLNELERIVSNGEKLTKTMVKYNEVLQDHYFRAERLKILAQEMTAKRDVQDLKGLNYHLRNLKSAMFDTKRILDSYKTSVREEVDAKAKLQRKDQITKKKKTLLEYQLSKASKSSSNSQSNRLTSQNTGLLLESNLNQELELSRINHQLAKTNRMNSEKTLQENLRAQSQKSFYSSMHTSGTLLSGGESDRKFSSHRK